MKENIGFFITPEHKTYFEKINIPDIRDDELIVQTKACGICGSDIHNYKEGRVGYFKLEKPCIPGHEASGVVTAVGKNVDKFAVGDRVIMEPGIPCRFCEQCAKGRYNICNNLRFMSGALDYGAFRTYFSIRQDLAHSMPESMTFLQGALVEPTSVALHVLDRAGAVTGKSLVILGAGPIGLLAGMAFKALGGGMLTMVDINDDRLKIALNLCADEVINVMKEPTPENYAQIVIETAGTPVTVGQLFTIAAPGARVVQVGWLKDHTAEINISYMLMKEIEYVASFNYVNNFPAAIQFIASGRIDAEKIVKHTFTFEQSEKAFEFTANNPLQVLKTIVTFD